MTDWHSVLLIFVPKLHVTAASRNKIVGVAVTGSTSSSVSVIWKHYVSLLFRCIFMLIHRCQSCGEEQNCAIKENNTKHHWLSTEKSKNYWLFGCSCPQFIIISGRWQVDSTVFIHVHVSLLLEKSVLDLCITSSTLPSLNMKNCQFRW